jgi:hypothetical protein
VHSSIEGTLWITEVHDCFLECFRSVHV